MKYEAKKDIAPKVVAKGKGFIAQEIIKIAKEHNIPIYEDPQLVEILSKLDLGEAIPPELYQVVAEILAWVFQLNKKFS